MIDYSMVKCNKWNQEWGQVILSLNEVNFTAPENTLKREQTMPR